MDKWSRELVVEKLEKSSGFRSFIKCTGRGYLPVKIDKVDVLIFRESVGVSFFYRNPVSRIEDANSVNSFMKEAIPYLREQIENTRTQNTLYNHSEPSR